MRLVVLPLIALVALTFAVACGGSSSSGPQQPTDVIGSDADAAAESDVGVDAEADTAEEQCTEPGDKPIGAECASHCECDTGYCYDEAYMAPFRFCTRECEGSCGQGNACINMSGMLAQKYGLKFPNICQVRCGDPSECADLSPKYDSCGENGFVKFDGNTVGAATCHVSAPASE